MTQPGALWSALFNSVICMRRADSVPDLVRQFMERGECTDEHAREIIRRLDVRVRDTLRGISWGTLAEVELTARLAGANYVEVLGDTRSHRIVVCVLDQDFGGDLGGLDLNFVHDQVYKAVAAGVDVVTVLGPAWQQGIGGAIYPLRGQNIEWLANLLAKTERALINIERSVKGSSKRRDRWSLWAQRINAEITRRG